MTAPASPTHANAADFLAGGGEMAALILSTDWSQTPLGPIAAWPQSLRTTVSLCLGSNFPINIIWGPEHSQIYNDGYRVVCGDAHPQALGEAYTKTWASAWPAIGAPFDRALEGQTSFLENQRMFLFRNGYLEETFFTFSLSPIRDESGGIGGLFHPVTETTASMLAERRTRMLRDLNARLGEARTTEAAYAGAMAVFADNAFDLPFVRLHDLTRGDAPLVGAVGFDGPLARKSPLRAQAFRGRRTPARIDGLTWPAGARCGPYEEPPATALVFPISIPGLDDPVALLIAGASPRLPLDESYKGFFSLLTAALASGLANARTYEAERQRAEALAALDHAKTAFFSNVSHEFRTPLTLMLGPIEDALAEASTLPPAQRARLEVAHRNAQRLLKLVNSLLDFTRVEAGRRQARFEATDLGALTSDLASTFRSACERAGLALTIDCPPLPQPVYVDRDMWEKIVLNLVSNAFKFTLAGAITVSLREAGGQAELTVRDTGVGISEAELPRVFERFHRIEGQKGRTHEGTGIGLALVAEMAKLHGGAASVTSRLDEGSAFVVRTPLGRTHLPAEHVSAPDQPVPLERVGEAYLSEALRWLPEDAWPGGDALVEGRPRVVLADDNADMRGYVRRLLEEGGYEVEAVENGRLALEALLQRPADLVLSDVMMPELDGFGLLAAIRADPRLESTLVLLLSARAGEEARVEGLAAGADDYLVKPFSARELRARVDGAVRLARARNEHADREQDLRTQLAVEQGRTALRQTEQELQFALHAGRMGTWALDLETGRIAISDYFRTMFGFLPHEMPDSYAEVLDRVHPEDRERRQAAVDHAVASGEDLEVEYRILTKSGRVRWILARGRAEYDGGRAKRIAGISLDITARKDAEALQELLLDELNHRVKNTLATVQAIALQTQRNSSHPAAFNEAFLQRLMALSRAHEMLTRASWQGASLEEVVERSLKVQVGDGHQTRCSLSGPAVLLGPNAAVTLNMAFHELATNAVKYGAFSTPYGRVDVAWAHDVEGRSVVVDWRESGGPAVAIPTHTGFGSRLIEQGLTRELGGSAQLTYLPGGLWCRLRLPFSAKLGLAA